MEKMRTFSSLFNWLRKQAKDEKDRKWISRIENWHEAAYEKGEYPRSRQLFSVNLGGNEIWFRKRSAYATADIFGEIFREKAHFLAPQFSGKGAKTIVDLGANEGFYTLKLKENNPKCKIVAVEPNPFAFELLKKNVGSNKLKGVILINKAIDSKIEKIDLRVVEEFSQISSKNLKSQLKIACPWLKEELFKKISVECITLPGLCRDHNIKDIDILKIDTEGMEIQILKSSQSILKRIKKIVVEWHTTRLRREVKKFLEENNFKLVFEDKGVHNRQEYGEFYFVREFMTTRT